MKVIVALSGGVDSAVVACLLAEQGHDVSAMFMKNWDDDGSEHCTSTDDFLASCQVADHLGIDLEHVNFSREYKERVFCRFIEDMEQGLTPNPDVLCNSEIKFDAFMYHALQSGADMIATGHYARIEQNHDGKYSLCKSVDELKDQTYFLHRLNQWQLSKAIFPVGDKHKSEVRKLAKQKGLPNHDRRDSTGICFIGERHFGDFIKSYIPECPGSIVDDRGNYMGEHRGIHNYTIGQRKGLGIGGVPGANQSPWYVVRKDIAANRLIVTQGDNPLLYSTDFIVHQVHWIENQPQLPLRCLVKIRHQQTEENCLVRSVSGKLSVDFLDGGQRAVTPGQHAVFYSGAKCLGGGYIMNSQH